MRSVNPGVTTTLGFSFRTPGLIGNYQVTSTVVTTTPETNTANNVAVAPMLLATVLNTFFNANVIPINFMVIGMAAVLSASIHAPFTALFLVCGMIKDYTLFFPILAVVLIAKYTSKLIFPYTVYNYSLAENK